MRRSASPPLVRGACQIWWARVSSRLAGCEELLDPIEQRRAEAYRRPADRRRFVAGVAVSRLVLAGLLELPPALVPLDRACPRCGAPHGRPRLRTGEIAFSVSHSGDRVGVAFVREALVGVDVEAASASLQLEHLVEAALAPAERSELSTWAAADLPRAFLTYWTRKEAVVKATGDGLSVRLPGVVVSPPGSAPALLSYEGRTGLAGSTMLAPLHPGAGYLASLAVIGDPPASVTEFDAEALLPLA